MHLNLDDPVAGAGLTASALYVKAKTSLAVSPGFGVTGRGKQIADQIKYSCVGGRIRSGSASNWRLVNGNNLVQLFRAFYTLMLSRYGSRPVQLFRQGFIQNLIYKRTLS